MINLANLYRNNDKVNNKIADLLEKDNITFQTSMIFFHKKYRAFCVQFVAHCRKTTIESFRRVDKAYWDVINHHKIDCTFDMPDQAHAYYRHAVDLVPR